MVDSQTIQTRQMHIKQMDSSYAQLYCAKKCSSVKCLKAINSCKNSLDGLIELRRAQLIKYDQPFNLKKGIKKYEKMSINEVLLINNKLNIISSEMEIFWQDFKKNLRYRSKAKM